MKFTIFLFVILFYSNFTHASQQKLFGDKVEIGNGTANTYVALNEENQPVAVGIALSEQALEGLPMVDQTIELNLPAGVVLPPYDHILINWNALGHGPTGIYDIPHFDFHFYGISMTDRKLISCQGDDAAICTKAPDADIIPMYYNSTPNGVAEMGWHWFDTRSPEMNGQRFTSTFIYGYYNAQLIFLEPMITREFLASKGSVDMDLSVPKKYSFNGYYPKRYSVSYSPDEKLFFIALTDLIKNEQ